MSGPCFNRLTAAIGAEVTGIDLRRGVSDQTAAVLRRALAEHQVLLFRDQPLEPEEQLRFAECFGPVMLPLIDTASTNVPGVTVLDQTAPKGQYTDRWHADSTNLPEPPLGAVLLAVQLPAVGGDTCFASMAAAFEVLSPALRGWLEDLTAEHSTEILDAALGALPNVVRRDVDRLVSHHPVVRVHPVTGRKGLFVNSNFTTRIDGLSRGESEAVLDMLFRHIDSPQFQVRWRWEPTSMAVWDNRAVQHCAVADYQECRVMHRCLIAGDRPIGAKERVRKRRADDRADHLPVR
jgi:taurine dioxygenase